MIRLLVGNHRGFSGFKDFPVRLLCKPLRYRGPNWMPITPITGPYSTPIHNNLHHARLLLMQMDNLLAPLMQLGQPLFACIILAHAKTMHCFEANFKTLAYRVHR